MFALPGIGGAAGGIKSIQRGIVTGFSGTVTIAKVDPNKSVVIIAGGNAAAVSTLTYVSLTDATTLTFAGSVASTAWQVLEFA